MIIWEWHVYIENMKLITYFANRATWKIVPTNIIPVFIVAEDQKTVRKSNKLSFFFEILMVAVKYNFENLAELVIFSVIYRMHNDKMYNHRNKTTLKTKWYDMILLKLKSKQGQFKQAKVLFK